jgi:hypothetical protein
MYVAPSCYWRRFSVKCFDVSLKCIFRQTKRLGNAYIVFFPEPARRLFPLPFGKFERVFGGRLAATGLQDNDVAHVFIRLATALAENVHLDVPLRRFQQLPRCRQEPPRSKPAVPQQIKTKLFNMIKYA